MMMIMKYLCAINLWSTFVYLWFFFFFQAEDGIRDLIVTGVQTCALPIFLSSCFFISPEPIGWDGKKHEDKTACPASDNNSRCGITSSDCTSVRRNSRSCAH